MPYKTRPYIPGTFVIPNPFRAFVVDGDEISLRRIFSKETVHRGQVTFSEERGILQKLTDTGNMKIYEGGGLRFVFERAMDFKAFEKALRGKHKDVQPPEPEKEGRPWHEDHELQPFLIGIPAIPRLLYDHLRRNAKSHSGPFLKWHVREGDWVKRGEIVAEYQAPPIKSHRLLRPVVKMPSSGKIVSINSIECADWDVETIGQALERTPTSPEKVLFAFQRGEKPHSDSTVRKQLEAGYSIETQQSYLGSSTSTWNAYEMLSEHFELHKRTCSNSTLLGGFKHDTDHMREKGWQTKHPRDREVFARIVLKNLNCHVEYIGDPALLQQPEPPEPDTPSNG